MAQYIYGRNVIVARLKEAKDIEEVYLLDSFKDKYIIDLLNKSGIKVLKLSDIDSKFSRDTSDNLLVKTQGLLNLYQCDIPREIANSVVNLFNDANSVTKLQEKVFGPQASARGASNKTEEGTEDGENKPDTTNPEDKVAEQNNNIKNTEQIDDQGK